MRGKPETREEIGASSLPLLYTVSKAESKIDTLLEANERETRDRQRETEREKQRNRETEKYID